MPAFDAIQNKRFPSQRGAAFYSVLWGLVLCAWVMVGCPQEGDKKRAEAHRVTEALLDQEPENAARALRAFFPGARREPGSFARFQIQDPLLHEVTWFTQIRSGRVESVVLKFSPSLSEGDRGLILKEFHIEEEVEGVREFSRGHLLVRVRSADVQGRLTITVEASPEP